MGRALLTPAQLAREWNVSPRTVLRYIERGYLKATRLPSGHHRISRADADAAVDALSTDTPTLGDINSKLDTLLKKNAS